MCVYKNKALIQEMFKKKPNENENFSKAIGICKINERIFMLPVKLCERKQKIFLRSFELLRFLSSSRNILIKARIFTE